MSVPDSVMASKSRVEPAALGLMCKRTPIHASDSQAKSLSR